ncbi:probable sugar phosphate/phosphate translocator At1g06470 isoform X4 [Quercus robur]|uniref:probable sugar phosphate/phosphate translocator At1g06470 isoform X4 n=1 Tax=Quercus robur TaxID=38942 RepID=UPI0021617146|nr:probable sugar phosphate/phosphate translocator At1g06470 isoform X4 [Quercus robur]
MVERDLDTENTGYTGVNDTQSGNQGSGLRREPSFSGWCDEDGRVCLNHQLENADECVEEDSDFELPLLQQGEIENRFLGREDYHKFKDRRMYLNGSNNMDDASICVGRNENEKYVPFNIENGSARETNGADVSMSIGNHESMAPYSKDPISVANVLKTLFFILVWYTFSLLLTIYNKSLLGEDLGKFPAPLLMNTVHFTMQAVLSWAITWFWSHRFEPSVAMSWRDYFLRVVPTALGSAMDINLSNASLVFVSVTFATMCKSASPIFLLLFAFAFRLESPSIKLSGIILIISVGILLTVAKETEFEFLGFILVMLAAVMSGFRWAMTQILLQVLTEYILVSVTSAVTVTIAGVVKEAVTIVVAVFYFHDEFTWLKGAGLFTIMIGVSLFNWYKYQKLKKGENSEDDSVGPLTTNVSAKYVIIEEDEHDDGA